MSHVTSRRRRLLGAVVAAGALGLTAIPAGAQEHPSGPETVWTYESESFATGVANGYQLALDPVGRKVYLSDANWHHESRHPDTGEITVVRQASGKLVEFDTATRSHVRDHSFLGLTRNDGTLPDGAGFEWEGFVGNSQNSQRTSFSPYGVAVDGTTRDADGNLDPTLITTTARGRDPVVGAGGNVVIYNASQGEPTDADRLWNFDDGTPIFDGPRRIAVNTRTHKAYFTNLGTSRGGLAASIPGFIAIVDLPTRTVDARVRIPGDWGSVGVAVDEANDLVYVGTMTGQQLYVIDGSAIDTSDPKDIDLNAAAITELPATVGPNARPTYNAALKRVYVSAYASPTSTITVVDADPASSGYGTVIDTIATGPTNAVEVDGLRGLVYSANLGAQEVVVYDAEDHEELLRLPTSGNALNIGIDPVSRDVWVSNFSGSGQVDVFSVQPVVQGTTPDGAGYTIPAQWVEGQSLTVSGTGWTDFAGTAGSTVAVKIDFGGVEPTPPLTEIDDVWAIVTADADGNWTATIPYPGPGNSNAAWQVGESHRVHLLSGSLGVNDRQRSPSVLVDIVAAGAPVAPGEPTEPGEPNEPDPGDVTVTFDVDSDLGGLSLSLAAASVDLGEAALNEGIDRLVANGVLPLVTVTDTRVADPGWAVSGSSSAFVNGEGDTLSGSALGWTPAVLEATAGQVVTAGPTVAAGTGFTSGATLASAGAGVGKGTARANASLRLEAPTNTPSGAYLGTITLTLS